MNNETDGKKKIYYAVFFPALFCFFVILAFLFELGMEMDFTAGGIFPRELKTLPNIFTMPFIHSDWKHLTNNVISFFVLSVCLYYFYGEIANRMLFFSMICTGLILWIIGRDAWHIGLSGMVYALSFFLFFSGIIRRYIPLIAISLIIVFLYGNNVWYLFPWQELGPVSWEGHLSGAITGVLFALLYRKKGPQKPIKIWEDENDEAEDDEDAIWQIDLENKNELN